MKLVPYSRLATKTAGVAAVALLLATAAAPAWAASHCGGAAVPLPGGQPVKNEPVHHGVPTLKLTLGRSGVASGRTGWQFHLTETNQTGAAYTHMTPIIGVFGFGADFNPKDTSIEWMKGSDLVPLPVRGSCDPTVWLNSAALDGPLANGASRTFDLYVSTPSSDARNIKHFQVYGDASADGTHNLSSNILDVTNTYYAAPVPSATTSAKPTTTTTKPTTGPTKRPTTAPTTTPRPTTTTTTAASTTPAPTSPSPSPTATTPALATTGGGNDTGLLTGSALVLVGVGTAVTVALRRRNRHN